MNAATCASSSPSTITRISGSVPDLRSSTRPRLPSVASTSAVTAFTASFFQRIAATGGVTHANQNLREHFSYRRTADRADHMITHHRRQNLQPRYNTVASGRFIQQNNVTRVFRADAPAFLQFFQHVAVAHFARANGMPPLERQPSPILLIMSPPRRRAVAPRQPLSRAMIYMI